MKRRQFLRGAAVSAGAVALAGIPSAASVTVDPTVLLAEEWLRLDTAENELTGPGADKLANAICDQRSAVADELARTRAVGLEGVNAKLRMMRRWYGFENGATVETVHELGEMMALSVMEDVAQLLAASKVTP